PNAADCTPGDRKTWYTLPVRLRRQGDGPKCSRLAVPYVLGPLLIRLNPARSLRNGRIVVGVGPGAAPKLGRWGDSRRAGLPARFQDHHAYDFSSISFDPSSSLICRLRAARRSF